MNIKRAKELAEKYNAITTDAERYLFLRDHNTEMGVVLDNDCTMVSFLFSEDMDRDEMDLIQQNIYLKNFHEYHGWGEGVIELFEFAGITAEPC